MLEISKLTCSVCGEEKHRKDFYVNKLSKTGRRSECKKCSNQKTQDYKKKNAIHLKKMEQIRQSHQSEQTKTKLANTKKFWLEHGGGRDVIRANTAKYRALKSQVESEKYSTDDVISLYGIICYLCNKNINLLAPRWTAQEGWENGLHIDHLIPISLGGKDTLDNVRPVHGICNIRKKGSLANEYVVIPFIR